MQRLLIPEKWLDIYEWFAGKISAADEVQNGGGKGEILGVVIYV